MRNHAPNLHYFNDHLSQSMPARLELKCLCNAMRGKRERSGRVNNGLQLSCVDTSHKCFNVCLLWLSSVASQLGRNEEGWHVIARH